MSNQYLLSLRKRFLGLCWLGRIDNHFSGLLQHQNEADSWETRGQDSEEAKMHGEEPCCHHQGAERNP